MKTLQESILGSTKSGALAVLNLWLEEKWFVNQKDLKTVSGGIILNKEIRFNLIDYSSETDEWKKIPSQLKIIPGPKCKFYFRKDKKLLEDFDLSKSLDDKTPCTICFYDFEELSIPEWVYNIKLKKLVIGNCGIIGNLKLEKITSGCKVEIDNYTGTNILNSLFNMLEFRIKDKV
jgi:hypothetical protein